MNEQTLAPLPLLEKVGFDYAAALREMLQRLTYEELAFKIGYGSAGSLGGVLKGMTPSHRHGEAIWALYVEMFGRKPPMTPAQAHGTAPNETPY